MRQKKFSKTDIFYFIKAVNFTKLLNRLRNCQFHLDSVEQKEMSLIPSHSSFEESSLDISHFGVPYYDVPYFEDFDEIVSDYKDSELRHGNLGSIGS